MGLGKGLMWRAAVATAALAATALMAAPAFTQAPQEATFKIDPPSQNVQLTESEVSITMKLEDAVNLAAWEFRFAFDPDVLTYKNVTPSGFLAQSGRTQQCLSPKVEGNVDFPEVDLYGVTAVQYGCNTPGSSLPGVNGDGDLATVRFTTTNPGVTPITCVKLEVTDALSTTPRLVTTPCTAVIKVLSGDSGGDGGTTGGSNNNGNSSNNNQLEPTPTPNVRVLTPTAIPGAPVLTPTLRLTDDSGVDPTAPGAPRSGSATGGTTASSGSGAESGSAGGRSGVLGGIQGVANAPVAGYGMARDAFFTLSLWAQLTLLAGVLVAGTGAVVRVRTKR